MFEAANRILRCCLIDKVEPVSPAPSLATPKGIIHGWRGFGGMSSVSALIAALFLPSPAASEQPQPGAACGAYDVHVLTLLEDSAEEINSPLAAASMMEILRARKLCFGGQVSAALAVYDEVERKLPALRIPLK